MRLSSPPRPLRTGRGRLRRLDPPLHPVPRQAPPPRGGSAGSESIPGVRLPTEKDPLPAIAASRDALDFLYSDFLHLDLGELPWPRPPRLLDQVRQALRVRPYAPTTEDCYVQWARRFILFHARRHPPAGNGNPLGTVCRMSRLLSKAVPRPADVIGLLSRLAYQPRREGSAISGCSSSGCCSTPPAGVLPCLSPCHPRGAPRAAAPDSHPLLERRRDPGDFRRDPTFARRDPRPPPVAPVGSPTGLAPHPFQGHCG